MKFVIPGGLGHIGSRVIRKFASWWPGSEIVIIDNLSTQRYCSLFDLPSEAKYCFIEGDVLEIDLDSIFTSADVAIQLAAITDAAGSFENRERVEKNNFQSTRRIAKACANNGCNLIHLSSTSVYGTQNEIVSEDCSPDELKPQSPYAETKLKEENFLREFATENQLDFITCRFGTICGISPGMRFHTAVNKFCWQAALNEPLTVWSTALHQKRPYLDLEDALQVFKFIIDRKLFNREVYNALTANLTVNDIIEIIRKKVPNPEIRLVDTEIMNQLSYEVSREKIEKRGFKFNGNLHRAINDTLNRLQALGP